jgi:hypothetical protein
MHIALCIASYSIHLWPCILPKYFPYITYILMCMLAIYCSIYCQYRIFVPPHILHPYIYLYLYLHIHIFIYVNIHYIYPCVYIVSWLYMHSHLYPYPYPCLYPYGRITFHTFLDKKDSTKKKSRCRVHLMVHEHVQCENN